MQEARAIGATCGGVRVWSLYVPNGRSLDDEHMPYKLELAGRPQEPRRQLGHRGPAGPDRADGRLEHRARRTTTSGTSTSSSPGPDPRQRARARRLPRLRGGRLLQDVVRPHTPGPGVYTYWDYTQLRFPKKEGMRIDFILGSPALAARVTGAIDRPRGAQGQGRLGPRPGDCGTGGLMAAAQGSVVIHDGEHLPRTGRAAVLFRAPDLRAPGGVPREAAGNPQGRRRRAGSRAAVENAELLASLGRITRPGGDPFPTGRTDLVRVIPAPGTAGTLRRSARRRRVRRRRPPRPQAERLLYCPSQLVLRAGLAANALMEGIHGPLAQLLIPEEQRDKHQERIDEVQAHEGMTRVHTRASTWGIPFSWFSPLPGIGSHRTSSNPAARIVTVRIRARHRRGTGAGELRGGEPGPRRARPRHAR